MLIQVIGAFFSVVAFSFLLHVPRKYIIWAGFTGAVGWWIYLFLIGINLSVAMSTFLSGCLVSLCGQIFARVLKAPVTIFVIPGILPLVPGAGIYYTMSLGLGGDVQAAVHKGLETAGVAGSIAVAILLVSTIFRLVTAQNGKSRK